MAARFWVTTGTTGGTGNWSNSQNWSATSGGTAGASVPGSADTAAFDASSGAGIATVDSNVTIQTLTMTGFTGTLAFGTNTITLNNNSGTVFTGATTHSVTGTPVINITPSGSPTSLTVTPGAATEANSISFNFTTGTYTLSFLNTVSNTAKNVDFTGFSGTWGAHGNVTIYGNITLSTGMTFAATASTLTLGSTSATQTITSNGKTFDSPVNIIGAGTRKFADTFTVGATRTLFVQAGTFDLNNNQVITGLFNSSYVNVRTLAFGTGSITCNAAGGTLWDTTTVTNLAVTGNPVVNISNSGAVATTVIAGTIAEANSISFNFTTGTYALTFLGTASHAAKNVDFTGFGGTWNATAANFIYGSLTLSTGMTLTASTGSMRFAASSGTQIITSNAKTMDFPVAVQGTGSGIVQLADALTLGATRVLSIQTGTLDGNNKPISGAASINISTTACASYTVKNISTALTWNTGSSSVVTLGGPCTFGPVIMTNNPISIDVATYQLTCTTFTASSGGSFARTITFGTGGNITCNGAGGTLVNLAAGINGLTLAGTPIFNISYSGATAVTIGSGNFVESNTPSFNFTTGTYALTFLNGIGDSVKNVDFTGFGGTWASHSSTCIIYGNLTLSSVAGFAVTATANTLTFGATSGTQIITSNAKTHDYPIALNGVGGTVQLADALLMGATRALTHTNGTLDLNGKTLTVGTAYTTATGTKVLTFNGGTLVCPAVTTTAFNNAAPAGFTTTAGTGTGKISMTGATAKTFVGGGSTYNCTLSNDGAGALTISGANTFTTIANGVQPTQFTFTSGTTTTVTNWNVSGISGSLVTIISSTAGTAATLSKASGTVYSYYVSLKDSAATGGASWYAAVGSTNVSGNSGWVFGVAKYWVGGTGNWSTAARWALSSGGAGGSGITPADSATFDAASGGGTSTVDSNVSVQTLTMTGYTGTLAFGTNTISLLSSGNVYTGDATYSVSGTPVINVSYSGSVATTITPNTTSEANTISFNITAGTYSFSVISSPCAMRSLNFTGFSGTIASLNASSIFGDITLSPTCTFTSSSSSFDFQSTSATVRVITCNGIVFGQPIRFIGVGGNWRLADALTLATGRNCTIANGTLDLNGKTLTLSGSFVVSGAGTKNITFNGGTINSLTTSTTAFNVTGPTGFTTTAGTGSGSIIMAGTSAKTFVGGGATFNCTLSNGGAGLLTISGNNTIDTLTRTAGNISITGSNTITTLTTAATPVTFTFTVGTTQTITNWNLNGTAGNLVTINSSTAAVPALLSKASGTVSADYLSIQDSSATGGASWYAGSNSTNVSGNSGWIFSAPPVVTAGGNFFFMF